MNYFLQACQQVPREECSQVIYPRLNNISQRNLARYLFNKSGPDLIKL